MINKNVVVAVLLTSMAACSLPPSNAQSGADAPRTHIVEIRSFAFSPARLTIKLGDTIQWKNDDLAPHTATANGGSWSTETLKNEETGQYVPKAAGSFAYHCKFHPAMIAFIVVEP
jgi:plastocyanin